MGSCQLRSWWEMNAKMRHMKAKGRKKERINLKLYYKHSFKGKINKKQLK